MSRYIDDQARTTGGRSVRALVVSLLVTLLSVSYLSFGVVGSPSNPSVQSASAKFNLPILCGNKDQFGWFGQSKGDWGTIVQNYPAPDAPSRRWTLQEAYGSNPVLSSYTGENGKDQFLVIPVGTDRGKGIGNYEEAMPKLEKIRTADNCLFSTGMNATASNIFAVSTVVTFVSQSMVTMVFDSSIICKDSDNDGRCFNLLKVVGGAGSDKGLIGALTNGLYFPLLSLVALTIALWMGYIGIAKRKYREAFQGLAWTVVSVIGGIALLLNPQVIAKAPMVVSNTVGSCVIGAFSGTGCGDTSDRSSSEKYTSDAICKSTASGLSIDEQMSLATNTLSCQMWKAFVLEPWTNASFGVPFQDMDVTNPKTAAAITKAGFKPEDFCVPLRSDGSVEDQGSFLQMNDSAKVCNVAAYQLYLKTKATGASGTIDKEGTALDENWYKVILVAAADRDYWDAWSLSMESGMGKIGGSIASLGASIIGSTLIVLVAGLAFIYLLKSIILMAFAPFFALVGIHPGRGRKLLIGFVESIVANVLKYIASAVFLVITLSVYGAVLGGVAHIGMTMIFVILMSGALWMYRSEIIGLIGKTNMGGQSMSSQFGRQLEKMGSRTKRLGVATAGGAIGGALANGGDGNMAGSLWSGAKGSMKRDLKRGRGTIASVVKERDRALADNKRDLGAIANREKEQAGVLRERLDLGTEKIAEKRQEFIDRDRLVQDAESVANEVDRKEAGVQKVEANVLHRMAEANQVSPQFVQYMKMGTALQMLEARRRAAERTGDLQGVNDAQSKIDRISSRREELQELFTPEELESMENEYQGRLSEELALNGLSGYEPRSGEYIESRVALKRALDDRDRTKQEFEHLTEGFSQDLNEYTRRKTVADTLQETHTSLNSGDGITKRKIGEIYEDASVQGGAEGSRVAEEINEWSRNAGAGLGSMRQEARFEDPWGESNRRHDGANDRGIPSGGFEGVDPTDEVPDSSGPSDSGSTGHDQDSRENDSSTPGSTPDPSGGQSSGNGEGFSQDLNEYTRRKTVADTLQETHTSLNSGDGITKRKIGEIYEDASVQGGAEGSRVAEEINEWSRNAGAGLGSMRQEARFEDPWGESNRRHDGANDRGIPSGGFEGVDPTDEVPDSSGPSDSGSTGHDQDSRENDSSTPGSTPDPSGGQSSGNGEGSRQDAPAPRPESRPDLAPDPEPRPSTAEGQQDLPDLTPSENVSSSGRKAPEPGKTSVNDMKTGSTGAVDEPDFFQQFKGRGTPKPSGGNSDLPDINPFNSNGRRGR